MVQRHGVALPAPGGTPQRGPGFAVQEGAAAPDRPGQRVLSLGAKPLVWEFPHGQSVTER